MAAIFAPQNRRWLILGVIGLAVAVLAAVLLIGGGGDEEAAPTTTSSTLRPTTTTQPPSFPLTGLPDVDREGEALPVLAVKLDGSNRARPQEGLEDADVVYEEEVEGGITRFIALFHSTDPEEVGPVRSIRPMDPNILAPLGGLFAFSGGIPEFKERLKQTSVQSVNHDDVSDAYERKAGRQAPLNLFADTETLWDAARTSDPPPPLFAYLGQGQQFNGEPASTVSITFSSTAKAQYQYDPGSGTWNRTHNGQAHQAASGDQIAPDNVIVQMVTTQATAFVDPAGMPVTESIVIGQGEALVFVDGELIRGTWSKPDATSVTTFTDTTGNPILLKPGRTWVHFVTGQGAVDIATGGPAAGTSATTPTSGP